jgi:hypothetical protein
MKKIIFSFFIKKQTEDSEIIPKRATRVVYPFEGYEKLSLGERYKVIAQGMIENKVIMKK